MRRGTIKRLILSSRDTLTVSFQFYVYLAIKLSGHSEVLRDAAMAPTDPISLLQLLLCIVGVAVCVFLVELYNARMFFRNLQAQGLVSRHPREWE